ncbi:ATP-binding cassette domain-containing protein [Fimbriimonadia bacterium ATM]|nr:MAG: ATP-binding cassette domain-containing protein [Armatimonadota bacterium]MBC6969784.1 ATP-binding cassette domain-containing protein [Armatimonadota bacterium]MCE7899052.1 ATP-binding cassette domain-containing protein [Armatimonadetes bacterium ATM1]MDL1927507.1 ATP-binding cassette domain-containing protein [Fimbriimonadia bacterium ATM]RIJ96000.1 MAG: ABC transporter ATP-binding protein [Armatimonadota bacterium]
MIRVRGLSHRFGDRVVLAEIDVDVSAGETVAIMGSSGGGKTTLLRCMAGLLRPTSGTVELFDVNLYSASSSERAQVRKRLGVVFQGSALFDYLNVHDNVAFGAERHLKLTRKALSEMVAEKLGLVGLEGTERLYPSELSGGMKKRVGLARALAMNPEVVFYDEPTSGLDPVTAYAIDALIREVSEKTNVTSIVVTHDVSAVMRVADRVLFLHDGRIAADLPPERFRNSKDPAIAEIVEKSQAESIA